MNESLKFIYDTDTYQDYFSKTKNKNLLTLNQSELDFLNLKINEIKKLKNHFQNDNVLKIPIYFKNKFFSSKI